MVAGAASADGVIALVNPMAMSAPPPVTATDDDLLGTQPAWIRWMRFSRGGWLAKIERIPSLKNMWLASRAFADASLGSLANPPIFLSAPAMPVLERVY